MKVLFGNLQLRVNLVDSFIFQEYFVSPAGKIIRKLKAAELIEPANGLGKGKYKFIVPKE